MKNKKLLIISLFFSPEPIGISKYTGEMAQWLSENNFDVQIITAKPFYPQWKIYSAYAQKKWWYQNDLIGSVKTLRCPIWVPKNNVTGLKRILHLASFGLSSSLATLTQIFSPPDLVFVIQPTIVNIPAALMIAKLLRKPAWLHIQDFEFDLAQNLSILGGIKKPFAFLQWLERILYRSFDKVSTISNGMLKKLVTDKQVRPSRSVLFQNWVDCDIIKPLETSSFRDELSIPQETIVALYSGNMGRKYDLEMLANTAHQLANESNILFIFCGDGVARPQLEQACKNLSNVKFLPLQPEEKLNDLLNLADIHLLPQKENAADSVMPSKLLGILASGKPVIASVTKDSDIGREIEACGIIIPPNDKAAFIDALTLLANNETLRHNLGNIGRQIAVQKYGKRVILAKLGEDIAAIC